MLSEGEVKSSRLAQKHQRQKEAHLKSRGEDEGLR